MNTNAFPQSASDAENKLGSYWNKPGGKIGTLLAIGLLGVAGYKLLPILTAIIWNTINFGIALGVAFLIYLVVSNRKTRLALIYLYNLFIKYTFGIIFQMDPFLIAEDYITDVIKERENLQEKATEVDAQKEFVASKIKEKQKDKQKCLDKAVAAQKMSDTMEVANQTRQVTRIENYINQLTPIKQNLEHVGDYLTKVHKNSKYMLEDMQNDLAIKKDLFNSVTKGNNALKSAMKIFTGDAEKKLLVEQSMEYLGQDIASKVAGMKKAISCSGEFMNSIDLDNATYEAEGLRMLEEYKPELFLTFNDKGEKVKVAPTSSQTYRPSQYDDLIK